MEDELCAWKGNGISFIEDPNASYYPLVLENINRQHPEEEWKLEFQTKPECKVIFTGEKLPSTESVKTVLSGLYGFPVLFIDIVLACAGNEIARRTK